MTNKDLVDASCISPEKLEIIEEILEENGISKEEWLYTDIGSED